MAQESHATFFMGYWMICQVDKWLLFSYFEDFRSYSNFSSTYIFFFEGGEVNVSDIQSVLEKMGIELTDKECSELKKYLPVDGEYLKKNNVALKELRLVFIFW